MRLANFVAAEHAKDHGRAENLCGVLVHFRPERREAIGCALAALPGVEVHHATDDGRMVVTVEDAGAEWAGATITRFNEIEGVLNVALVYHHFGSEPNREIPS